MDHLTFEGKGGRIGLIVQDFFCTGQWCRQFFRAVHAFFYGHLYCIIFLTVKALQEFFSQIFHSPPQRSNGPPLKRSIN